MATSDKIKKLDEVRECRNIKESTYIGGDRERRVHGHPGDYFTRSVKRAKREGWLHHNQRERCNEYKCANTRCGNRADRAGHVWLDGAFKVHKMYLAPICQPCNDRHDMRYDVSVYMYMDLHVCMRLLLTCVYLHCLQLRAGTLIVQEGDRRGDHRVHLAPVQGLGNQQQRQQRQQLVLRQPHTAQGAQPRTATAAATLQQ